MASRPAQVAWFVTRHALRALWVSTMVLTPLFGFWLASSLAAFHNATQWLALLGGLLLFPILPVGWDLFFMWRRRKQEHPKKAILTRLDRLVLRTLLINGLFLGCVLYFASGTAFRALAVRGDWMLDGHHGPVASSVRGFLLGIADRLDERRVPADDRYGKSDQAPDDLKGTSREAPKDPSGWPYPEAIDPLVSEMPESAQTDIDSVGKYLAARFTDKKQLVKAMHDYVVLRLSYDHEGLKASKADRSKRPSQVAEDVFAARKAVCEGYSRLMVALGKSAGVEVAYITGYVRDPEQRLDGDPWGNDQSVLEGYRHAWNAVQLDGHWYLVDTTWDDPTGGDITTTYLLVPPKLMAYDHFPAEAAWQLVANPISLGDFVRQPLLSPAIGKVGLSLVEPLRSQITVDGEATVVLDNPHDAMVSAVARAPGAKRSERDIRCDVTPGKRTKISCALPDGEYELHMFAAPAERAGTGRYSLDHVGSILVNSH